MIDPAVRPAGTDDACALVGLETAARDYVGRTRGGNRWLDEHPTVGEGWPELIAAGGVYVAEIVLDGGSSVIVGFLAASVHREPVPLVMVDQVFVDPEARELGFGDALVAAAVEYGRQAGADLIEAHTLPGDRDLKNLYERAGITARLITVSRSLRE